MRRLLADPVKIDFGVWTRAVAFARRYEPEQIDVDDERSAAYWADCVFLAAHCRPVGVRDGDVLLACAHYDRDHMTCRAYADRPPVCRGFPWYDHEEGNAADC